MTEVYKGIQTLYPSYLNTVMCFLEALLQQRNDVSQPIDSNRDITTEQCDLNTSMLQTSVNDNDSLAKQLRDLQATVTQLSQMVQSTNSSMVAMQISQSQTTSNITQQTSLVVDGQEPSTS
jgi:hypothetical protein